MDASPTNIAHSIELAVAPVFLIAGIGALLTVLTNRLGRVVDRSRGLEIELSEEGVIDTHPRLRAEIWLLDRRISWINRAIVLSTAALLLVCLVIMTLFTGQLFAADVSGAVAVLFILAMAALIAATGSFLWEIHVAAAMLRVRTDLMEKVRNRREKKAKFWKKIF
ncbi:DUF2721 domain-containing protein [Henriciella sp. AS95]|uniref:DUF2721 domain-containing protein n=1 Tax=Henriciella sp. AS95 TaxID=3135782 RepID=UPI0031746631